MKRLYIIILLAAVTLSGMAQTIGEAFYIYRNDGQINGFLRWEVDSIGFSNYDSDSIEYNEIVTQVVYTADSIYRIPLAVIDSVGFVTPETKYKPGVINLSDQLMPYVTACDSLTITFSSSIPPALMPKVGDKLMTLEMNDYFPAAFAGEVSSIEENKVVCSRVSLEDIFETYYDVSSVYGYIDEESSASSRRNLPEFIPPIHETWERDFKLHTFTIPFNAEISRAVKPNSDLALKGGTSFAVEITPSFHVRTTLIVSKDEGTYLSASVTGEANVKETFSLYGGLEWSHDFFDKVRVESPIAPYVNFVFNPGLFLRAGLTASITGVLEQNYSFGWGRDWSSKGREVLRPSSGGRLKSCDLDVEGCIDGSIAAGAFVEVGVALLCSDLDKVVFRGELGGELVGHAVLYNSDIAEAERNTGIYERLRNSSFDLNAFVSTSMQAELVGGLWGGGVSLPWNLSYNIYSWNMVPTFSNTKFRQQLSSQTSVDASADMSGDCLIPVLVGMSVRDKSGNEAASMFADNKFDHGNKRMEHTFTGLSTDTDYTLYPKVRIFGFNLLASPSAELERQEFPVEITDFKQTASEYRKDGFSHNGKTYSYQYDCTVTVALKNSNDVEDWGWVYRDPDGQEAFISLKSFSSPYSDSRYVYLRNEAKSTATVYPYVKLRGGERQIGEPHDYPLEHKGETTCPDGNHPHMIDLGLPSGTLWACCNVGASAPEQYGNYYAWGETSPKSIYIWDTYQYGSPYDDYVYIGSDIAGTGYDAATANWGSPWRMPSLDQVKELLSCSSVWTTQNGVNGRKFTGPNGGTIFLPAAGDRWNGELVTAGSDGGYWSSTLAELFYACGLQFHSGNAHWNDRYERFIGLSVRPVR